jgi:hypothetical protein
MSAPRVAFTRPRQAGGHDRAIEALPRVGPVIAPQTAAALDASVRSVQDGAAGARAACLAVAPPKDTIRQLRPHAELGKIVSYALRNAVRAGEEKWKTNVENRAHA